jgi:hypothetical protein
MPPALRHIIVAVRDSNNETSEGYLCNYYVLPRCGTFQREREKKSFLLN